MSLRSRLLAGMALIALVLATTAVAVTRLTERRLIAQIDERLESPGPIGGPPRGGRDGRDYSALYVALAGEDGSLQVIVEPDLAGPDSAPEFAGVDLASLAGPSRGERSARFNVDDADGSGRYRVLVRHEPRLRAVVLVATSLDEVDDTIGRLRQMMAVATALTLAVLALVTWWVMRLGVRPLKQMTVTARAIADGDFSQRVAATEHGSGTEAAELGGALNTMMGKIESAFAERTRTEERLRRFVGDASHELRTPVQTIRGYGELYRLGALGEPAQLDDAMARTEAEAKRMGAIIEDLLLLARLDEGRPLDLQPVDLAQLVNDAASDARARDPQRVMSIDVHGPVLVLGDDHRLRQVVSNLVSNSMVHTPVGSAIRIAARSEAGDAILEVEDQGPGLAAEQITMVFERFWRADPARARHRGGSGLGLSIVQSVVEAHGGRVDVTSSPESGTTVTVRLPGHGSAENSDGGPLAFPPPVPDQRSL